METRRPQIITSGRSITEISRRNGIHSDQDFQPKKPKRTVRSKRICVPGVWVAA